MSSSHPHKPSPEIIIFPLKVFNLNYNDEIIPQDSLSFCVGTSLSLLFHLLDLHTLLNLGCTSHTFFKHCSPYIENTFWFQQALSLPEHSTKVCSWYKPKKVSDQVGDALNLLWFIPTVTQLIILDHQPITNISSIPPLNSSLPATITHLTFGNFFPHPIDHLPPNLTHLTLNYKHYFEISTILPQTLTHLTLGANYSTPLLSLPPRLVYLNLGPQYCYDVSEIVPNSLQQLFIANYRRPSFAKPLPFGFTHLHLNNFGFGSHPLKNFPQSITHLTLNNIYFQHFIPPSSLKYLIVDTDLFSFDSLPNGLIELEIGKLTSKPTLPSTLKSLIIQGGIDCASVLPHSLTDLTIMNGNDGIPELPPNLINLSFTDHSLFDKPLEKLPNSLKSLIINGVFNQPLTSLPDSLHKLTTGCWFNQPVDNLSSSIRELHLGDSFNQPVDSLPPLHDLYIGHEFNQPINHLPSTLYNLILGDNFNHPVDNLPSSLQNITLGKKFDHPVVHLPPRLLQLVFKGKYFDHSLENLPESIKLLGACREPACNARKACHC